MKSLKTQNILFLLAILVIASCAGPGGRRRIAGKTLGQDGATSEETLSPSSIMLKFQVVSKEKIQVFVNPGLLNLTSGRIENVLQLEGSTATNTDGTAGVTSANFVLENKLNNLEILPISQESCIVMGTIGGRISTSQALGQITVPIICSGTAPSALDHILVKVQMTGSASRTVVLKQGSQTRTTTESKSYIRDFLKGQEVTVTAKSDNPTAAVCRTKIQDIFFDNPVIPGASENVTVDVHCPTGIELCRSYDGENDSQVSYMFNLSAEDRTYKCSIDNEKIPFCPADWTKTFNGTDYCLAWTDSVDDLPIQIYREIDPDAPPIEVTNEDICQDISRELPESLQFLGLDIEGIPICEISEFLERDCDSEHHTEVNFGSNWYCASSVINTRYAGKFARTAKKLLPPLDQLNARQICELANPLNKYIGHDSNQIIVCHDTTLADTSASSCEAGWSEFSTTTTQYCAKDEAKSDLPGGHKIRVARIKTAQSPQQICIQNYSVPYVADYRGKLICEGGEAKPECSTPYELFNADNGEMYCALSSDLFSDKKAIQAFRTSSTRTDDGRVTSE